jgi:hypothetical protein
MANPKQESAGSALRRAIKKMKKLKSYHTTARVVGGITQGKDPNRFSRGLANTTYNQDTYGGLEMVTSPQKGFRPRRSALTKPKGVIKTGAIWKGMMSTEQGRLINRLFLPPESYMDTMYRIAKLGKWLPPEQSKYGAPGMASSSDFGDDEESEDIDWDSMGLGDDDEAVEEKATKKTKTRKSKKKKSKKASSKIGPLSHSMILRAPLKTAIEVFNYYMDSGCGGSQLG